MKTSPLLLTLLGVSALADSCPECTTLRPSATQTAPYPPGAPTKALAPSSPLPPRREPPPRPRPAYLFL